MEQPEKGFADVRDQLAMPNNLKYMPACIYYHFGIQ